MKTRITGWIAAVMLITLAHPGLADDKAALVARLHSAETDLSIDSEGLAPWHLKLDFQLYDAKGKPTETGAVEEWWAGPHQHLVVYTSPTYSGKVLENADGIFYSGEADHAPELIELLLNQVVHPMPPERDIDGTVPELRKQSFGKVPLECIMLSQPIKMVAELPLGLFPTYCFDPGTDSLRASYDFGSQTIVRNLIGVFQKHNVSTDITIDSGLVKAASGKVVELRSATIDPAMLLKTDDMRAAGKMARIGGGMMAGQIVSKVQPFYPEKARMNHVSGSVIMRAIIGRNGRIYHLQLMSFPDSALAIAALEAVRQWTYKPYLLNGEPVEVDTTITVNFNIAPR